MPHLLLRELPKYECLLEAVKDFPDLDPSACEVYLNLLRAGDEAFRVADTYLNEQHLSSGRFGVLMHLIQKPASCPCPTPRTPAELAELSGVTRATMTGLVDTLERDGLVTREPDPQDRRMMFVKLTEKGQTTMKNLLPGHFKRMAMLMSALSEPERRTLVALLGKIVQQANTISPLEKTAARDGSVSAPETKS